MTTRFENFSDLIHNTHAVQSGDVTLHVETLEVLDSPTDSRAALMLSEAEAPSSRWSNELLIGMTRAAGRCVWFDTRDVGASTWCEDPYEMADLVADAQAVAAAVGITSVDVFGRGMGGEIGLRLALTNPDLVRSLIVMSTTPGRREEFGLPDDWLIDKMGARLLGEPPANVQDQARWIVDQLEWFNGPVFNFDRDLAMASARLEVAERWRGPNGHGHAVMEASDIVDALKTLDTPTTLIHGTADPVLPLEHARALNTAIGNSTLKLVEGLGHELPDAFVEQLLGYIGEHFAASSDDHAV